MKGKRKVGGAGKRKKEGIPVLPLFNFLPFFSFLFALSQFRGPDYLEIPVFDKKKQKKKNKNDSPCVFILLLTVFLLVEPFGSRFIDV